MAADSSNSAPPVDRTEYINLLLSELWRELERSDLGTIPNALVVLFEQLKTVFNQGYVTQLNCPSCGQTLRIRLKPEHLDQLLSQDKPVADRRVKMTCGRCRTLVEQRFTLGLVKQS